MGAHVDTQREGKKRDGGSESDLAQPYIIKDMRVTLSSKVIYTSRLMGHLLRHHLAPVKPDYFRLREHYSKTG